MLLCRVLGTVVSNHKEPATENIKFLLTEILDGENLKPTGNTLVAMDSVGAGIGEVVMVVQGSSARMTETTEGKPADATIMAIVEQVEVGGQFIYEKHKEAITN
ncbi:MAG: ethanolamine utilization protein EutN [Candidatus Hydrogenedentota bacterium]|nr:MAG: ethanolamine utilization protein EutN [Candidatus Hydrogenedentota bacterium]